MSDVPSGWSCSSIGEAGCLCARRVPSYHGVKPYVATADVNNGVVIPSGEFEYARRPARADLLLRSDDVIQAKMKATDKALLVDASNDGWLASTGFAQFTPSNAGNSPEYFLQVVSSRSFLEQKDARCVGSTQQAISDGSLASIPVLLPPAREQSKIAQVLDTLDTAIAQTEAIIAKLKAVKQGLLHDLVTRGIDANGELRPPQSEAPQLYKESALGWIPTEWQVELLDEITARGTGHTPSKSSPSYWNGGIKWVSLADSHRLDDIYIYETDKEISALGLANSSAVLHPAGTVILSRDAGIGKSAVLASEMAVSQHFIAWRCGPRLNNLFLYFWLQHEKRHFESIALGSTILTIGLPFFKRYKVVVPPRAEQDLAAAILMNAEANLASASMELDKLRNYKIGLMDDLLTGNVRVTGLIE